MAAAAATAAAADTGGATQDRMLRGSANASRELVMQNGPPTAWWYYHGQTPAQVSSSLTTNSARIVSLQVEQASPVKFAVTMVPNSGSYAKAWWWYYDVTASQLSAYLTSNNARLEVLVPYVVNGNTLFAAVMVSNTGSDAKAWWWYHGVTSAQVGTYLQSNKARLVDINSYSVGGGTVYAAVMIANTGADARTWWWYLGVTGSNVGSLLNQNGAVLTDISPADSSGSTFNVIMEKTSGFYWWWYHGLSAAELSDRVSQNGARIFDLQSYYVGGVKKFAAIMLNNANAATTRIGQILRSGTDGKTGLYLKQVGGAVQASLQAERVFEPASTIKIIIGLHAMRQVDAGLASLSQNVVVYAAPPSGSCPTSTIIGNEPMGDAILMMLENSDNQRTRALIDTFGFSAINQMAHSIGMASTNLNHYPGCGGPTANQLTLANAGLAYEGISGTLLTSQSRSDLYERMPAEAGDFTGIQNAVNVIVDQEAGLLGLSSSSASQFKARILTHYKAGGYTLCPSSPCLEYRSVAGTAEIPKCMRGTASVQQYVFGIFIDGATSKTNADNTFRATMAETLREPIRASLGSWSSCYS
jgi:hypothetical protein